MLARPLARPALADAHPATAALASRRAPVFRAAPFSRQALLLRVNLLRADLVVKRAADSGSHPHHGDGGGGSGGGGAYGKRAVGAMM
jgi:uncharacterized membrane protein YgcG